MRSNTAPGKPQQLHFPPGGGWGAGGRTDKEKCVRISIMRTDCRSGIQSTADLIGFWETGIVQVLCFNKIPITRASVEYAGMQFPLPEHLY